MEQESPWEPNGQVVEPVSAAVEPSEAGLETWGAERYAALAPAAGPQPSPKPSQRTAWPQSPCTSRLCEDPIDSVSPIPASPRPSCDVEAAARSIFAKDATTPPSQNGTTTGWLAILRSAQGSE